MKLGAEFRMFIRVRQDIKYRVGECPSCRYDTSTDDCLGFVSHAGRSFVRVWMVGLQDSMENCAVRLVHIRPLQIMANPFNHHTIILATSAGCHPRLDMYALVSLPFSVVASSQNLDLILPQGYLGSSPRAFSSQRSLRKSGRSVACRSDPRILQSYMCEFAESDVRAMKVVLPTILFDLVV